MAVVKIQGAVKLNAKGNSFTVLEDYFVEINGTKNHWTRRWQVWATEPTGLKDNEIVVIEGELGTKIDNYTNKDGEPKSAVAHSINNPVIVEVKRAKVVDEDDYIKYGTVPF